MMNERPWWPKSLHQASVLDEAGLPEDELLSIDLARDLSDLSDDELKSIQKSDGEGLALRWSAFWMVASRKALRTADRISRSLPGVLPVPAIDQSEYGANLSAADRRRLAARRRASTLARARAQEHAVGVRRRAKFASSAFALTLGIAIVAVSSNRLTLPDYSQALDDDNYIYLTAMDRIGSDSSAVAITEEVNLSSSSESRGTDGSAGGRLTEGMGGRSSNASNVRPADAEDETNSRLPFSGNLFQLEDLFSAVDENTLPRTALAAPGWPSKEQIDIATNHFHVPGERLQRTRTMVAQADEAPVPVQTDERPAIIEPRQVALAYAPVQNMDEFKSPFAVVLNMPSRAPQLVDPNLGQDQSSLGEQVSPDTVTSDGEPDSVVDSPLVAAATPKPAPEAPKITIAGRIPVSRPNISSFDDADVTSVAVIRPKLRRGSHAWAANKLPRSVFSRREQRCLAAAIYFEARGESEKGQAAVAQVIINRVKNPTYPASICGVVYQNKKWRNRCQFSFACDGIRDRVRDKGAYTQAIRLAKEVTRGKTWLRSVGDSTHYHATYVRPKWARKMKRMTKIGSHIFYRTHGGGWS